MIELTMLVCSLVQGGICKDVSLTFTTEDVSLMQCIIGAQPIIAQWSEQHPNWTVSKWQCGIAGQFAKV